MDANKSHLIQANRCAHARAGSYAGLMPMLSRFMRVVSIATAMSLLAAACTRCVSEPQELLYDSW